MAEPNQRIDLERLQIEHPTWRLFRAHPATGLEECKEDHVTEVTLRELGQRWLTLPLAEQQAREADYLRGLLEIAAHDARARFEAVPQRKQETSTDMALQTGGAILDDGAVIGRLTPEAIDALVATPWTFGVDGCAHLALVVDGPRALAVWVDRWKAEQLQQDLETRWWDRAQARERSRTGGDVERRRERVVDRELRARVLLTWKASTKLLLAGVVLAAERVGWQPLGWFGTALAIIAVGVVILIQLDRLIERWYRRAAARP